MPTLRDKMKQEMILRGFSLGTQDNYLRAVIKLNDYFNRNPAKLTTEEIKSFFVQFSQSTYRCKHLQYQHSWLKIFLRGCAG